jgi:Fe-S cluster assembly iron-binding protein IscA
MAVTLTPNAAQHVAANLNKRGKGVGLRLGVRRAAPGSRTSSSTPTRPSRRT